MEVNRELTLEVIIKLGGGEILSKNGVPCMTCPLATAEINTLTIGQVCSIYGLDLKKILTDLNNLRINK